MNRVEELKHYITDPETSVVICTADLAPIVAAAQAELPEGSRVEVLPVESLVEPILGVAASPVPGLAIGAYGEVFRRRVPLAPSGGCRKSDFPSFIGPAKSQSLSTLRV